MSDGPSDAARASRASIKITSAAQSLEDALFEIYDGAFGLPQDAIDIVNDVIYRFGVKLVKTK